MACLRSLALRASPRVGRPAVVAACRCRTAGAASGAACDATARSAAACAAATDDTTIAAAAAASASVAAGAIAGGKVIGATDAVCLRGCASGAASGLRVPRDGSGFSGLRVPHDGSGFSGVCIGCILLHAPPHAIRTERCAAHRTQSAACWQPRFWRGFGHSNPTRPQPCPPASCSSQPGERATHHWFSDGGPHSALPRADAGLPARRGSPAACAWGCAALPRRRPGR